MKRTTLALDERILEKIRRLARKRGRTVQECANWLLRQALEGAEEKGRPDPWPACSLGKPAVDIADREALLDFMDGGR